MKLGEMLLRDARITEGDLDRAIAHQQSDGGRLGSILVEMGLIDAETLTVYLGLELGIPIATGATMERCKRSAVKLLTPEQAARLRCIPIVIQGQTLIVAMDDPHDMWALDELGAITGYRILPRVAPEVRVFYYLERFYGVARPPRWAKLGDLPRGSRQITEEMKGLPAPPLPGLPPRREKPVRAPTPAPMLRRTPTSPSIPIPPVPAPEPPIKQGPQQVAHAYQAIETDAADLVIELEKDSAEVAPEAPPTSAKAPPPTERPVATTTYQALSLDAAISKIKECDQRGEIADILLAFAAGVFEVATLFMVRDNMAFGWKGFGPGVNPDRIESLLIPLETPSMFKVATNDDLFRGPPFPATLHGYLFKVLQSPPPATAVVLSVAIGRRVVNLLYGHKRGGEPLTSGEAEDLSKLAAAASSAYVHLITVSKQRRQASEESA